MMEIFEFLELGWIFILKAVSDLDWGTFTYDVRFLGR